MRRIAMDNWADYVADEVVDMKGHLMSYPIQVSGWCLVMSSLEVTKVEGAPAVLWT